MMMAMAHVNANCCFLSPTTSSPSSSFLAISPLQQRRSTGGAPAPCLNGNATFFTPTTQNSFFSANFSNKRRSSIPIPRSTTSSNSDGPNPDDASANTKKASFGYSRKDVILIGVGVTLLGIGLKTGLEFAGVDPLQAGNVVQLVLVLGLTVGWISTYIFRVSNKEMTYAQQLRDYESKVMEKRLESLTEAELEVLLQEVEEEKSR